MEKKTSEELLEDLKKVHGWLYTYWKHYKGAVYQITGFAFECNTNALMINYKKMANGYENITFTRSYDEWIEIIGQKSCIPPINIYRFVMI